MHKHVEIINQQHSTYSTQNSPEDHQLTNELVCADI